MVKYIFLLLGMLTLNAYAQPLLLADPTKPLNYRASTTQKSSRPALPKLSSILIADNEHTAILNDQLYRVGNWVNGYEIKKIEEDGILLRYKEKLYRLNLYSKNERFIE